MEVEIYWSSSPRCLFADTGKRMQQLVSEPSILGGERRLESRQSDDGITENRWELELARWKLESQQFDARWERNMQQLRNTLFPHVKGPAFGSLESHNGVLSVERTATTVDVDSAVYPIVAVTDDNNKEFRADEEADTDSTPLSIVLQPEMISDSSKGSWNEEIKQVKVIDLEPYVLDSGTESMDYKWLNSFDSMGFSISEKLKKSEFLPPARENASLKEFVVKFSSPICYCLSWERLLIWDPKPMVKMKLTAQHCEVMEEDLNSMVFPISKKFKEAKFLPIVRQNAVVRDDYEEETTDLGTADKEVSEEVSIALDESGVESSQWGSLSGTGRMPRPLVHDRWERMNENKDSYLSALLLSQQESPIFIANKEVSEMVSVEGVLFACQRVDEKYVEMNERAATLERTGVYIVEVLKSKPSNNFKDVSNSQKLSQGEIAVANGDSLLPKPPWAYPLQTRQAQQHGEVTWEDMGKQFDIHVGWLSRVPRGPVTDEGAGAYKFAGAGAEFICPIYEIMLPDPIVIASGQTHDDSNNEQWLDGSFKECPWAMATDEETAGKNTTNMAVLAVVTLSKSLCFGTPRAFGYFSKCLGSEGRVARVHFLFDPMKLSAICNLKGLMRLLVVQSHHLSMEWLLVWFPKPRVKMKLGEDKAREACPDSLRTRNLKGDGLLRSQIEEEEERHVRMSWTKNELDRVPRQQISVDSWSS